MLVQEFLQLPRIKIGEHLLSGDERRHVRLGGKLDHFVVSGAVSADINLGKLVTAFRQKFFGVDAPGAHGAAVEFETCRHKQ